jgi:hypothetical protein
VTPAKDEPRERDRGRHRLLQCSSLRAVAVGLASGPDAGLELLGDPALERWARRSEQSRSPPNAIERAELERRLRALR